VEGNVYFPPDSLRKELFKPTETHTVCPWKGRASYYTLRSNGHSMPDAAWFYPEPKPDAKVIRDRVAFRKDVRVEA